MKRILVVDDTQRHLDAAVQQLSGPDTEVVCLRTYWEAFTLLQGYNPDTFNQKPVERFDVVLTDLLMPAENHRMGEDGQQFIGQAFTAGWALAIYAAMAGVKLAAVATVGNHHDHPASAVMDFISRRGLDYVEREWTPGKTLSAPTMPLRVNESTVIICNAPTTAYNAPGIDPKDAWTKDWAKVMLALESAAASK